MKKAGLAEDAADGLALLPKGRREKRVLSGWIYGSTAVKRNWLAEQLRMGYETRMSQAVLMVEGTRDPAGLRIEHKLMNRGI